MGNSEFGTQNVELSKIVGLPIEWGTHSEWGLAQIWQLKLGKSELGTQNWELKIRNSI